MSSSSQQMPPDPTSDGGIKALNKALRHEYLQWAWIV